MELTINNIAALYFIDYFGLGLVSAGVVASLFGLMNIFARTMGGYLSDQRAAKNGLHGRVQFLFIALLSEGITLIIFSRMTVLPIAIAIFIIFSLCVQMSEGATYAIVPFINKRALGSVVGIVGAGGNFGAVAFRFFFRMESLSWPMGLLILGILVVASAFLAFLVRFSEAEEKAVAATSNVKIWS